jgi:uncharacterized protein YndB with AHSA1/START domain
MEPYMSDHTAQHDTFVIERTYEAPPAAVFAQWASREAKVRWFGSPEDGAYELNFTVGGKERNRGGPPGGPVFTYVAEYQDIVPDRRIVYGYVMDKDDQRISVSVTTVELAAQGDGTLLTFTEQGVFLDGHDTVDSRRAGTNDLLDQLGQAL